MRLTLILSVLALTGAIFFAAIQTLGAAEGTSQSASNSVQLEGATAQLEANRAEFDQQAAALNQTIADLNADNLEKAAEVEAVAADRDRLQAQLEETNAQLSIVTTENATLAAGNDDLAQELAVLTASIERNESTSREAETTIQSLNDVIAEGRDEIQTLQARIASLEGERAELTQQLAELESDSAAPIETADVAAASDRIERLTQVATAQVQTIAELTEETASLEEQVVTLMTEASNLSDEVGKRDTVIAGLMARTETADTTPLAECQARTNAALAAAQVSFEEGSTTLTTTSIPLLEELATIASDCTQANLALEIEGHTGDAGGNASNLLLSDGRAKIVRDFLLESGVPAESVRAVGFGGSEAVADSENDRIVFDWEQS